MIINGEINLKYFKRSWNKKKEKLVEKSTCWTLEQNYKSILSRQVELIKHIKEILLKIQAVLLTINTNFIQTIIFGLIKIESPTLLRDRTVYQL